MIIPWIITAFTVLTVYFLDKFENKVIRLFFNWIPAILLAYLIPALISFLWKLDYSQAPIHQFSRTYLIPLAIVAVMSSLSLRQLKAIGWKPIAVFVAGSAFIAIFPALIILGLPHNGGLGETIIQQEYWKGIPPIVGSWIGGSTSQLVLKELVSCPEDIFLSILVMDNVLVNIWTILMFQGIKRSRYLNRKLKITDIAIPYEIRAEVNRPLPGYLCAVILLATVLLSNYLIESFIAQIVFLSIIGLVLSNVLKQWNTRYALKAGGILILLVMAVLGLKLQFASMGFNSTFLFFLVVWLGGHFLFMILVAKLLNVNMAWVPIASMANVGGIATAPAVTAAFEKRWMPHAVILAILSMATGTFWGIFTIYLLQLGMS